eukprot:12131872-Alexandrium_andersonii.AAC.1
MVEVPRIQFVDDIVDAPVEKQRQVSTVQAVQERVEVPQLEIVGEIVDIPVQKQEQVPIITK